MTVLRWNIHEWCNRTPGEVLSDASAMGEADIERQLFRARPEYWNVHDWAQGPRDEKFTGLAAWLPREEGR